MRRFGKSKLLGPLILLSVAVVFIGINVLEAKKPPRWEWQVGIPNKSMAETGCKDYPGPEPGAGAECNLYANPHGYPYQVPEESDFIIYTNDEYVEVEFWTREDRQTGQIKSTFSLGMKNTEDPGPGYYSVGFRDVVFIGCIPGGKTPCRAWVLPTYDDEPPLNSVECSFPNCCGTGCGSTGFWYMQDFLNDSVEPTAHPSHGYKHFGLRFSVFKDIESMKPGEKWIGEGDLWWISVKNTSDTLVSGDEQYHNITVDPGIPLEDVTVFRENEYEWIITVDQCGPEVVGECEKSAYSIHGRYIGFWEMYYQGIRKGNSRKFDSEWRWALGARTPFKFVTKWTRVQVPK